MTSRIDLQNSAQNTNLPDNGENLISAEDLRNQLEQERNSTFNLDDDDAFTIPFSSSSYGADNVGDALNEVDANVSSAQSTADSALADATAANTNIAKVRETGVGTGYTTRTLAMSTGGVGGIADTIDFRSSNKFCTYIKFNREGSSGTVASITFGFSSIDIKT